MEMCSKNGNLSYHKYLASKEFADLFLLLLKRVSYSIFIILEERKIRAETKI